MTAADLKEFLANCADTQSVYICGKHDDILPDAVEAIRVLDIRCDADNSAYSGVYIITDN